MPIPAALLMILGGAAANTARNASAKNIATKQRQRQLGEQFLFGQVENAIKGGNVEALQALTPSLKSHLGGAWDKNLEQSLVQMATANGFDRTFQQNMMTMLGLGDVAQPAGVAPAPTTAPGVAAGPGAAGMMPPEAAAALGAPTGLPTAPAGQPIGKPPVAPLPSMPTPTPAPPGAPGAGAPLVTPTAEPTAPVINNNAKLQAFQSRLPQGVSTNIELPGGMGTITIHSDRTESNGLRFANELMMRGLMKDEQGNYGQVVSIDEAIQAARQTGYPITAQVERQFRELNYTQAFTSAFERLQMGGGDQLVNQREAARIAMNVTGVVPQGFERMVLRDNPSLPPDIDTEIAIIAQEEGIPPEQVSIRQAQMVAEQRDRDQVRLKGEMEILLKGYERDQELLNRSDLALMIDPETGQSLPFGTTVGQARKIGAIPVTATQVSLRQKTAAADQVVSEYAELANRIYPESATQAAVTGGKLRFGALSRSDTDAVRLQTLSGVLATLVRAFGDVGALNKDDIARAENAVPGFFETRASAQEKIRVLTSILDNIKKSAVPQLGEGIAGEADFTFDPATGELVPTGGTQ